ncbi:MAG: polynucleotide adenylyltransferase PcnB [Treponema sp.]|nr:polynucleotide adenylyltransferase PcnB [Treponema sp.]
MLYRYATNAKGKPVKKAVIYTRTEHSINPDKVDPDAKRIITMLRQYEHTAYIVGGAVRDLLVGKTPKDFDIVTDATPMRIKRIFRNARIIGKRFRLVHVIYGPKIFEVCTFRSLEDGTVGNSFGTIDDDAKRRDFTLNALYYDPINEQILDYVGGVKDIADQKINPVIPLRAIFTEDPVRMIRAIKYAAMTGFSLPFLLKQQTKKDAALLRDVSPSRITEELVKIINSGYAAKIVSLALEFNLYIWLQPAATAFIAESLNFKTSYLKRLAALDSNQNPAMRYGERLSYFLHDYVLSLKDWQKEIEEGTPYSELFDWTWKHCRSFVLPMNPVRTELEFAVRFVLNSIGVPLKARRKPKTSVRRHQRRHKTAEKSGTKMES